MSEDLKARLQEAIEADGSVPLVFDSNWLHVVCGGPAELSKPPYAIGYCQKCGKTIPVEELEESK